MENNELYRVVYVKHGKPHFTNAKDRRSAEDELDRLSQRFFYVEMVMA